MKRVLLIVAFCLCLVGASFGAEPNSPTEPVKGITTWFLSADDADSLMGLRLGYEMDRIEPGVTLKWFTRDVEWGPAPRHNGAEGRCNNTQTYRTRKHALQFMGDSSTRTIR